MREVICALVGLSLGFLTIDIIRWIVRRVKRYKLRKKVRKALFAASCDLLSHREWYMCKAILEHGIIPYNVTGFTKANFNRFIRANYPELEKYLTSFSSDNYTWMYIPLPQRVYVNVDKAHIAKSVFLEWVADQYYNC